MKSNCCKAPMRVVGTETKHYRCNHCGMPCDQAQEETKPTYQEGYDQGIVDGLKLSIEAIENNYDANVMANMSSYDCEAHIHTLISNLIKQHSGE